MKKNNEERKDRRRRKMELSKHAEKRFQQRGFSKIALEIIEACGRRETAPGGVERLYFGDKECQRLQSEAKRIIQLTDKIKGGTLIVNGTEIITLYKKAG